MTINHKSDDFRHITGIDLSQNPVGSIQPAINIRDSVPPSDTYYTPASGYVLAKTLMRIIVEVKDGSGGSWVREVRYDARWQGTWFDIGVDATALGVDLLQ